MEMMGDRYDKYFRIHPALGFSLVSYMKMCELLHREGDLMVRHDSSDDSWWVRGTWENSPWHRLDA